MPDGEMARRRRLFSFLGHYAMAVFFAGAGVLGVSLGNLSFEWRGEDPMSWSETALLGFVVAGVGLGFWFWVYRASRAYGRINLGVPRNPDGTHGRPPG